MMMNLLKVMKALSAVLVTTLGGVTGFVGVCAMIVAAVYHDYTIFALVALAIGAGMCLMACAYFAATAAILRVDLRKIPGSPRTSNPTKCRAIPARFVLNNTDSPWTHPSF